MKYKLNKKGEGISFSLNNLSELFLAVIGIILIITVIVSTYSCNNTKEQQAKGTLDNIYQIITSLNEGEEKSLQLYSPTGWNIVSFNKENNINGKYTKPNSYFEDNLICLCEKSCKYCRSLNYRVLSNDEQINIPVQSKMIYLKLEGEQINVRLENLKKTEDDLK